MFNVYKCFKIKKRVFSSSSLVKYINTGDIYIGSPLKMVYILLLYGSFNYVNIQNETIELLFGVIVNKSSIIF